jgi:threonine/homoserine/homoserine lactone efflux protein
VMTETVIAVLSIAGAITLGAMSPGPSFLLVARTSAARSRADGLWMALAMGVGGAIFAVLALFGVHAVLSTVPLLYGGLKLFGGAYLVYVGWNIWRQATKPLAFAEVRLTSQRSFCLGLLTQMSNPKTAVVYASVFVSLLPQDMPMWAAFALPPLIFCIEAGWYAIVALALSATAPAAAYLRWKTRIDRAAGGVMALLGLKLIHDAGEPPVI